MPAKVLFPSLGEDYWTDNSLSVIDYLYAHWMASDSAQTFFHRGSVASLPYLMYKHLPDIQAFKTGVENELISYFGKYFDDVEIRVEVGLAPEDVDTFKYSLVTSVVVTDSDGREFSVAKAMKLNDSKIVAVADALG